MPYVSCMLAPPNPDDLDVKSEGHRAITCIDDQGRTWFLTEDSQAASSKFWPYWLEYKDSGGTVEPYEAPEPEAHE